MSVDELEQRLVAARGRNKQEISRFALYWLIGTLLYLLVPLHLFILLLFWISLLELVG